MSSGKKWQVLPIVTATALALTLAACGGSSDDGSSGSSTSSGAKSKTVGVILPDATTSPRWEANDRPSLTKAFTDAGLKSNIQNAGGDKAKFGTICDSMINEGVAVIMIVNLDSDSGGACLKKAKAAGIPSIDYDRLTLGGGASYYVSFDNVKVGGLMGTGLQQCLGDKAKGAGVVYINGDPTDNNAALFKKGYDDQLKADAKVKILSSDKSGFWDAKKAGVAFDGLYTQFGSKIQGVISANDTMAGGIIASLKRNGLAGKVPVTGQDASVEGLQRILAGTQCMTVYKNTNLEADAASKLAIDLTKGDKAAAEALATGSVKDTVTGKDVKSVLATPEAIYQDSVKKVTADGFQKAADICTAEYAAACKKYGVS
jgi:D-xylose transport system substrate-binding protein